MRIVILTPVNEEGMLEPSMGFAIPEIEVEEMYVLTADGEWVRADREVLTEKPEW